MHGGTQAKLALRERMGAVLRGMPPQARAAGSRALCPRVAALPQWTAARAVMLYWPIATEPDLADLAAAAFSAGKVVCLPSAEWESGRMDAVRISGWGVGLGSPVRGIRQPTAAEGLVPRDGLSLVVVPGLSFDARGGRLGRGAGFYDRYLHGFAGAKVGVCFDEQVVDEVPMDAGDVRMDLTVTPTRTLARAQG